MHLPSEWEVSSFVGICDCMKNSDIMTCARMARHTNKLITNPVEAIMSDLLPDDLFGDPSRFEHDFPVWVIELLSPIPQNLASKVDRLYEDWGVVVPVFTDVDLARRFIGEHEPNRRRAVPISDKASLITLFQQIAMAGVTQVGYDAPPRGTKPHGWFMKIEDAIRSLSET